MTSNAGPTVSEVPVVQHPDTPTRFYMDDPNIEWRTVKPDYSLVNKKYLAERTRFHPPDSMEKFVENLVKTWEMESTHKINEKVRLLSKNTFLAYKITSNK